MVIAGNSAVSLHYEMLDTDNQLLDRTEEPIVYLHGGYDGISPLVGETLRGKEVGGTVDVMLSSDDAFGKHDPELVRVEDVSAFPTEVKMGVMFEADGPATGDVTIYHVTDVADGKTVVDSNYPLAGVKIRFKVTIDSIRDATNEEITYGHIRGLHGHHHQEVRYRQYPRGRLKQTSLSQTASYYMRMGPPKPLMRTIQHYIT